MGARPVRADSGCMSTSTSAETSHVQADTPEPRGIFDEIVVGIDGSSSSQLALRHAVQLRGGHARVHAISVAETHHAWHTGLEAADWTSWLHAAADDVRREAAQELAALPQASTRTVDGRPADILLGAAAARGADLIAIGTPTGGRAAGLLFGSTATRVAREATCSVLIARDNEAAERFPERIVVGVDGSAHAADAETVALVLADAFGADLRRVIATGGEGLDPATVVKAEIDARPPVDALVDASRNADLVVVGSRGLRGIASLGSVAERVAHRAASSVLIVRFR